MDDALKIILEEIRDDVKEIKNDVKKQNGRLRRVEVLCGAFVGGFVVVGYLLKILMRLL